jgi:hypothetical protein
LLTAGQARRCDLPEFGGAGRRAGKDCGHVGVRTADAGREERVNEVSERDLSLLREGYRAMGLGEARPVRRLFGRLRDDAARWIVVDLANSGRASPSRDDPVRDLFGSLPDHWELAGVDIAGMRVGGRRVVVTGHFCCRPRRGWDTVRVPFAHVWTLRDGSPQRVYSFLDGAELRRV